MNKAQRSLWNQGRTEIRILCKVWKKDHPSFDKLTTMIFGPHSKLFHLMAEELEMSYEKFYCFLATFFTAAMASVPAPILYDSDLFDITGLMASKQDYLRIYRKIDKIGAGRDTAFWMSMKDCFNNMMRKIYCLMNHWIQMTIIRSPMLQMLQMIKT